MSIPEPHGGELINRFGKEEEILSAFNRPDVPKIPLDDWTVCDLEMIACGGFSPLSGFMNEKDYISVIEDMRLSNGTVWSMPIVLPTADRLTHKEKAVLTYRGKPRGIIYIQSIYERKKELEAERVFRTLDRKHPSVDYIASSPQYLVGGEVWALRPQIKKFKRYYLYPEATRREFEKRGWRTVVGFQTRNPIHRAHEYIQKCALEICDGLFIHPIVGKTKEGDVTAEVRMKCYEVLINEYYPRERVMLCVNPSAMRYGGPREAILHAIVRKNYGCTHFIVGRDHAGVGNYYGPYDAQKIFDEFKPEELGINPLFFENAFYCKKCESMATEKTCPHPPEYRLSLSGTKVREMLSKGQKPPPHFTRKEIAEILIKFYKTM